MSSATWSHTPPSDAKAWLMRHGDLMYYTPNAREEPARRIMRAIMDGQVTIGGLAEAGWQVHDLAGRRFHGVSDTDPS